MITAAENPDGSVAVVILNPNREVKSIKLSYKSHSYGIHINEQAIQTIILTENNQHGEQ